MKIALAQLDSEIGDILTNTAKHLEMIRIAADHQVNLIVFPELSLTSYAPELAQELAMTHKDPGLNVFKEVSQQHNITIGLGLPVRTEGLPVIGLLLFEPDGALNLYGKTHLHEDEFPFFSPGENYTGLVGGIEGLTLSVCYEISVEEHIAKAKGRGAQLYLASVAKTASGVAGAHDHMQQMAIDNQMTLLMANCVGSCEGQTAGGRSAIWNSEGAHLAELPAEQEGLLIYEVETGMLESVIFDES